MCPPGSTCTPTPSSSSAPVWAPWVGSRAEHGAEHFDYSPGRIPPQGIFRIYGIGLPDAILKKVYHDNAARLLGMNLA